MKPQRIVITWVALLVLGATVITLLAPNRRPMNQQPVVVHIKEPLARPHAPTFGTRDAAIHIVKFLDPTSRASRDLYPVMKGLLLSSPGKMQLSIRYAPASDGATQVIRMLEAARMQGKYWESLELLLVFQSSWVVQGNARTDVAMQYLGASGLNIAQLRRDMASPEITARILQDRADAQALDVHAFPAIFINGQPTLEIDAGQWSRGVDSAEVSSAALQWRAPSHAATVNSLSPIHT